MRNSLLCLTLKHYIKIICSHNAACHCQGSTTHGIGYGQGLAATYLQLFMTAVGARDTGILGSNPNLQLGTPDPGNRGSAKI